MSNKQARMMLEMIYGKDCMFYKARIADRIKKIGGIKTYKTFIVETKYKSRLIDRLKQTMTYHHLEHQFDGGKTDIENGSIVCELAHRYLHSLPRAQEEIVNNMLREYKREFELSGGILVPVEGSLEIQEPVIIEIGGKDDEEFEVISLENGSKEEWKRKFNRAKVKRENRRIAEEELYKYFNEDELEIG